MRERKRKRGRETGCHNVFLHVTVSCRNCTLVKTDRQTDRQTERGRKEKDRELRGVTTSSYMYQGVSETVLLSRWKGKGKREKDRELRGVTTSPYMYQGVAETVLLSRHREGERGEGGERDRERELRGVITSPYM